MRYGSFQVWVPCELELKSEGILLEPGVNTFAAIVPTTSYVSDQVLAVGGKMLQTNWLDDDTPNPQGYQLNPYLSN